MSLAHKEPAHRSPLVDRISKLDASTPPAKARSRQRSYVTQAYHGHTYKMTIKIHTLTFKAYKYSKRADEHSLPPLLRLTCKPAQSSVLPYGFRLS